MDDLSGRNGDQRCFRGLIGFCQIDQVLQQAECEFGIEVVVCDPVMLAPVFCFDEDIVKKNAIMMIDFALDAERHRGLAPEAAIFEACLLRFRSIMMTTMAALLGALPLAIGMGDGAELRRPLGVSIVGGLIFSQALTLYTTPVIYLYIDRFRLWSRRTWGQRFLQIPDEPLAGTIL